MIFTNFEALAGSGRFPQNILNIFPEVIKVIRMFKKKILEPSMKNYDLWNFLKLSLKKICFALSEAAFFVFFQILNFWPEVAGGHITF